jgi:hypothetical protein
MISISIYGYSYSKEDWLKDHQLSEEVFSLTFISVVLYMYGAFALIIMSYRGNLEEVGDEFHYILNCPYVEQCRDIYIKKRYTKRPNIINFLRDYRVNK